MFYKIFSKLHSYTKSGLLTIFFMGFASGFPFALTASVMSLRLKESGVSVSSIGLFALVSVPYSFKYLWAPFIDSVRLPLFQKLFGRRRGWLCLIQALLITAVFLFGAVDPKTHIYLFAALALSITFLSATQDILIDAYRIERLAIDLQGLGASFTTWGWRTAAFISGVLPLIIAEKISWSLAYYVSAFVMILGLVTTLLSDEPSVEKARTKGHKESTGAFLIKSFVLPFKDLLKLQQIYYILAFIVLFKLGDAMAGVMTMPFLIEKGFNKIEIVAIVKTFGTVATFAGLFIGGLLAYKLPLRHALLIAGICQMLSNLLFVYQDYAGLDRIALMITIFGENLATGIGAPVIIAYLSSLCNVKFAATHFALLSSVSTLARNVLASASGFVVESSNWSVFFLISTAAALPALFLLPKITFFKRHRTTEPA